MINPLLALVFSGRFHLPLSFHGVGKNRGISSDVLSMTEHSFERGPWRFALRSRIYSLLLFAKARVSRSP